MGERGNPNLKVLDRLLGIPLVWCVGHLRTRRPLTSLHLDGAHAAVLSPAVIGDTVLASGLIQDLAAAGARVTLVTSPANAAVAPLMPSLAGHMVIPITSPRRSLGILRRARYDLLIDVSPWPRLTALVASLSGAKFTVGFETQGQYRHWSYDLPVLHRDDVHQYQNIVNLGRALGVPSSHPPRLVLPREAPSGELEGAFVVFHPWPGGYRSELKEWPRERWVALGERVGASGLSIAITGGPGDMARSECLAMALRSAGVSVFNCAGHVSLTHTAALLKRARAVVSVDTGILHVAAALNVPTIGLHGPTSSKRWGGLGRNARAIDAPGSDGGFLSLGFEYPRHPPNCMARIGVDLVWSELLPALGEQVSASSREGLGEHRSC